VAIFGEEVSEITKVAELGENEEVVVLLPTVDVTQNIRMNRSALSRQVRKDFNFFLKTLSRRTKVSKLLKRKRSTRTCVYYLRDALTS
jgi:hypothetical protein